MPRRPIRPLGRWFGTRARRALCCVPPGRSSRVIRRLSPWPMRIGGPVSSSGSSPRRIPGGGPADRPDRSAGGARARRHPRRRGGHPAGPPGRPPGGHRARHLPGRRPGPAARPRPVCQHAGPRRPAALRRPGPARPDRRLLPGARREAADRPERHRLRPVHRPARAARRAGPLAIHRPPDGAQGRAHPDRRVRPGGLGGAARHLDAGRIRSSRRHRRPADRRGWA